MREMVDAGEVDALVPERVWQEVSRGLMEAQAVAHVRGAARLRRARAGAARGRSPVGRAAARRLPPRGRHRRAPDDGARHGGAPRDAACAVRYACLGHDLGKGTTPAEILPRHLRHEERSVALVRAMSERLRVDNACRALADRGRARARQHPSQRRVRRGRDRAPARALRRAAPARSLRRGAARLRVRRARPPRPRGQALSAARPAVGRARPRAWRSTPPRSPRRPRRAALAGPGDRRGDPRRARARRRGACAEPSA